MRLIALPSEMQALARHARCDGKRIGLVPTMGFLHEGHLSLVRLARPKCDLLVVSVFVNPTQFGPGEDFEKYPRPLEADLETCKKAGVHAVFAPTPEHMYPGENLTWITVETITEPLCGKSRPGHFRGVTTVCAKLFNIVTADTVFFGQKDAQQAIVIRQMVKDLNIPLQIVICPTVREPDGLAMSSRNTYLNPKERRAATVLYRGLTAAREAFEAGERDAERLRNIVAQTVADEPLVDLQYVSCADPGTLQELETVTDKALLSMAAFAGTTRLIDNVVLGK